MEIRTLGTLTVAEPSDASEARRFVSAFARSLGFDEQEAARAGLVITEAATNLLKHARGGELIALATRDGAHAHLAVLVLDRGPGIRSVGEAMRDGYSTMGSPGTGLGAITRLSDACEIHSEAGAGTAMLVRLAQAKRTPRAPAAVEVGGLSVAKADEEACGDAWDFLRTGDRTRLVIADGLGHGVQASEAAQAAVAVFRSEPGADLPAVIEAMHGALRSTRGAVAAVAEIDPGAEALRFCGIGNISSTVLGLSREYHCVSHNGTLGHELRKVQEFTYPWGPGAVLVAHSDGLSRRWSLADHLGLMARDPLLIAGVLYRDHRRERDDATVVVAKDTRAP